MTRLCTKDSETQLLMRRIHLLFDDADRVRFFILGIPSSI